MRHLLHLSPTCCVFAVALAGVCPVSAQNLPVRGANLFSRFRSRLSKTLGNLPTAGRLVSPRDEYQISIGAGGAVIHPFAPGRSDDVRMLFSNSRAVARSEGLEPLPGKVNYLIGPTRVAGCVMSHLPSRTLPPCVRWRGRIWYGSEGRLNTISWSIPARTRVASRCTSRVRGNWRSKRMAICA